MQTQPWSSVDHYENFPVASWLVPSHLRPAVVALYRFARTADDIADEGSHSADERRHQLARLDQALCSPSANDPEVVVRLRPFIAEHALPVDQLRALLDAFAQDVHVSRYPNRESLLDYCRRSANPIGRLLLRLFGADSDSNMRLSDHICSALQLINFLQDVRVDWQKGRVYLPQDTLGECESSDRDIQRAAEGQPLSQPLARALAHELTFARQMLIAGAPLVRSVPWRLSLELRAIIAGGQRVLNRIADADYDVFRKRPTLGWFDAPALLALAIVQPR
ncbi:MAG: squalene synthase HpnC [Betaproteobacteria bacterium]|nr:squalene synthase HpnC [Betaproteobacteria bacterium]